MVEMLYFTMLFYRLIAVAHEGQKWVGNCPSQLLTAYPKAEGKVNEAAACQYPALSLGTRQSLLEPWATVRYRNDWFGT